MALIAWYKLDNNANDSSGNNHLTTVTATPSSNGRIGGCYDFISGQTITKSNGLTLPYNSSVSAWAKNTDSYSVSQMIFCLHSPEVTGPDLYFTSNTICWNTGDGSSNAFKKDGVNVSRPTANEWHHYVVVNDKNKNKTFLYIDGELWGEANYKSSYQVNRGLSIGNYTPGSTSYSWRGSIDDVRIYDHALSEKEIKELAKAKILHYTFDDFQEPTYNWFYKQNPRIDSSYASYVATTSGTWQANHPNAIRVYNDEGSEITGYINSGVTDWTNAYHAVWEYDYQLRMPVVVQNDVDGNWKAKSWGLGQTMSSMGLSAGMKYTISWLQWTNNTSKRLRVGLYGKNSSGSDGFHDGQLYPSNTMPYTWEKVSATFTVSSVWNFSASLNCYMYGHYDTRAIIKIADVQMEIKDHNTEFTKSPSRTGRVSDNSGYDNHADLVLATTPQWTENSRIGKGAYKFDGDSYGIQFDGTLSVVKTVSLWVKGNIPTDSRVLLVHAPSNVGLGFYNNGYLIVSSGGSSSSQRTATISNYDSSKWNHIVVTYSDANVPTCYINGVETAYSSSNYWVSPEAILYIGRRNSGNVFDGQIDDVRIYATALSADDVKELYQTRAQIDNRGNFFANNLQQTGHKPLLMDYTAWVNGTYNSTVGNMGTHGSQNRIVASSDPWGKEIPLWESYGIDNTTTNSGIYGGYNSIDNTKLYRMSWWEKRISNGGATYGRYYAGLNGSPSGVWNLSSDTYNTNPYFWSTGHDGLPIGEWFLVVGHVWPFTYTGGINHKDSGRWRLDGSKIGDISQDFRSGPATTILRSRTLSIYKGNSGGLLHHTAYPRMDLCDGTEPSIAELLSGFDSNYIDFIRSKGGTATLPLNVGNQLTYAGEISELGITNGLVAYYPLNGNAKDYTANNNDGTVNGAIISAGINGKACYSFDGVNDGIESSNSEALNQTESFSLSVWIKPFSFPSFSTVLAKGRSSSWFQVNYVLGLSNNKIRFKGTFSNNIELDSQTALIENSWYNIICTYDNDLKASRIFINSIKDNNESLNGKTPTSVNEPLFIGVQGELYSPFNGLIQNVRIYNRALSPEEIAILYDLEKPNPTPMKLDPNTVYISGEFNETL